MARTDDSSPLGAIEVTGLVRTYRRADRAPGLVGAVNHLFRPSYEEVTAVAGIDLEGGSW